MSRECVDGIATLSVSHSSYVGKATFMTKNPYLNALNMIFLMDRKDDFYKTIGGFSMPETVFINRNGTLKFMETSDTRPKENPHYVCPECDLAYKEEEWMKKCQAWCKEHKSCNLDIIKNAIMVAKKYDLVVIGTGSAGSTAASVCRRAGWSVAIVDNRPFGGTCALRGCDPKKVLVGAADLQDWFRRMRELGVVKGKSEIDWTELMKFKSAFTNQHPKNTEKWLAEVGIDAFHGTAHFVGGNSVAVGDTILEGRFVVIATGAEPARLPIEGAEHLLISDDFLELKKLPKRIIFVGGGYISMEFAHIAARAGADVTVLHRGERILDGFDADLVKIIAKATGEAGINAILGASVKAVESDGKKFLVKVEVSKNKRIFEADLVVHGAGRVPNINELDLEKGAVQAWGRGIFVNEYLQSVSNPAVYAAGDAAASGGLSLTPIAGLDGQIVAKNLLEGNKHKPDYTATPTVVFTIPPLASVGMREEQAKENGLKFRVNFQDTSGWYSSRRIGQKYAASKVLVEEGSDKILGAHILGHNAEEIINIFALSIRHGLRVGDLKNMIWAYPTNASDIPYML